ncbi:FecR family protein [Ravibacter arvi]|uniref:FecR family protein n=1 Tax=Ravibacter arvi TaxID=2051041 RepID=A0ABP8M5N5_9BACT
MSAFRRFSPEELAAIPSFRGWILFDDPVDGAFWKDWLGENPDKKELVDQSIQLLKTSESFFNNITEAEVSQELDRLCAAIGEESPASFSGKPFRWYWAAAVLLIGGMVGLFWLTYPRLQSSPGRIAGVHAASDSFLIESNKGSAPKLLTLEDGSTVLLQPGGTLRYPVHFSPTKREVFLQGEAFFKVTKDPGKPFFAYAGDLATKVLGTSFNITTSDNEKNVTVVVKTGKVSVFPILTDEHSRSERQHHPKEGMVLTPNQQIVYEGNEAKLTRSLVDHPEMLRSEPVLPSLAFKNAGAPEVFEALARAYGVNIVFDRETMKSCRLTAKFDDEPLFEKMNLICMTLGADFEQMDGTIIVSSQGCN